MLTEREQANRERLRLSKPLAYEKVMRFDERYARGESVAVIQLQYNYLCNMKCVHCSISAFQKQSNRRTMTPEDVKNLCDQADEYGIAQIDFSGGEPLAFQDLDAVLRAIGTERFYVMCDTNGWLMTPERAKYLKSMGVDRIQISLDSLDQQAHDDFRRKPGTHKRVIRAVQAIKDAGLSLKISTVVTPDRIKSGELIEFFDFCKAQGASINAIPAKPVGEWAGKTELLLSPADKEYLLSLNDTYDLGLHTAPHFGKTYGCIAVKKIISITAYGDVMPCIWMYFSLGNIFETPLRTIIEKGMRYFSEFEPACHMENAQFNQKYLSKLAGRNVPVPIEEIFPDGKIRKQDE